MCAIVSGGQVKCWGLNDMGQLGQGDVATRGDEPNEMGANLAPIHLGTGRSALALGVGGLHTCAILDDHSVKCWGNGGYGELGQGDQLSRGHSAETMGDNLPAVNLGTGRSAKAISAGGVHTCVILDDDSVKCWGYNSRGQLGLGDNLPRGIRAAEMGDALPRVQLGTNRSAKRISAGYSHTCALLDDDTVKCWGWGQYGILGQGDELSRGTLPGQMGDALPAISLGTGQFPQSVSSGGGHNCVVLNQGAVKCWGFGQYAQLGLPNTASHGDEPNEMGDNLPEVSIW
jgi:E3 ubiquitin-protein ligase HERC3